jgi:predicted phosphodiesterase
MRSILTARQYKQYEENDFALGAQMGRRRWGARGWR